MTSSWISIWGAYFEDRNLIALSVIVQKDEWQVTKQDIENDSPHHFSSMIMSIISNEGQNVPAQERCHFRGKYVVVFWRPKIIHVAY